MSRRAHHPTSPHPLKHHRHPPRPADSASQAENAGSIPVIHSISPGSWLAESRWTSNDQLDLVFDGIYAGLDGTDVNDPDNELLIVKRWDAALIEAVPIVDQELDDIGTLEPPVEDEEFSKTLLADQAAAFAEFTRLVNAAANGEQAALVALETDEDPFDDIDRRAREYGLNVCGESD